MTHDDLIATVRQQRAELLDAADRLGEVLAILSPAPAPVEIKPTTVLDRVRDSLTAEPVTAPQVAHHLRVRNNQIYKALKQLEETGYAKRQKINGIVHWTRQPEEIRLHVGEGEIS